MTEDLQQVPTIQENPPIPPIEPVSSQPRKSNKKTWIILGVVIGVLFLCAVVCFAIFGASMFKIYTEKKPIESVLTAYMQYMSAKDSDSAYNLFSPRVQRQMPISVIKDQLEGNNYFLFEGFQDLSATNLNISISANADPDLPQGTVATVTGTIDFEDGFQGTFDAVLEKDGGKWMLYNIYISVPPNKIK